MTPDDLVIPALIFGGRILDVSMGTVRMIMVISGHRIVPAILGFFEVIVWVLAAGGAIKNLNDPLALCAYAGGFAAGTLVGSVVEQRMALGYRTIRIINTNGDLHLADALRAAGYAVTRVEGTGDAGPVELNFLTVKRRRVPDVINAVNDICPRAFVSVERAERVEGIIAAGFPNAVTTTPQRRFALRGFAQLRK